MMNIKITTLYDFVCANINNHLLATQPQLRPYSLFTVIKVIVGAFFVNICYSSYFIKNQNYSEFGFSRRMKTKSNFLF